MAASLRERPTARGPVGGCGVSSAQRLVSYRAQCGDWFLLNRRYSNSHVPRREMICSTRAWIRLSGYFASAGADDREETLPATRIAGPRTADTFVPVGGTRSRSGESRFGLRFSRSQRRTVTFTRGGAQRLSSLLRTMESTERTLVMSARLVGGSLVGKVELELEDGSVLTGRVTRTCCQGLRSCSATSARRTFSSARRCSRPVRPEEASTSAIGAVKRGESEDSDANAGPTLWSHHPGR